LQRGGVVLNDAAVTEIKAAKVYTAIDEQPHINLKLKSLGELVIISSDEGA
jgi:hypothetical protein